MENNILVLGNGFDLYHNLKTKYYDFVQFACKIENQKDGDDRIKNICKENSFMQYFKRICDANNNWIDCEKEIENIVHTLQRFMDRYKKSSSEGVELDDKSEAMQDELILIYITKFIIREEHRCKVNYKYIKDLFFDKKTFLNDIKKELDDVIEVLAYYLKKEEKQTEIIRYEQIQNISPKQVINFNYTNTYTKIYSDRVPVFYPHGDLSDSSKMVLGIPDSENISLDFIYFKKFFQRIQKRCGTIQNISFEEQDGIDIIYPTVYFLGLSMGRTDEDIIKNIMGKSVKTVIFYYDQEDYEGKIINLIDIYGREKIEEWIDSKWIEFVELDNKKI